MLQDITKEAIIRVVGVGGGGGNAVLHMADKTIEGVEFVYANTDAQALKHINDDDPATSILQLGLELTKGLGAGAQPEIGRNAAQMDKHLIQDKLRGADMVFITAGMGGGTGTGGAPIVAEVAKELGILTVAIVTKPFPFEGKRRLSVAEEGIRQLSQHVDSLITIPNAKLLSELGSNISLLDAFKAANDVLYGAVQGIAELITKPGLINVDFADVRTVMSEMGMAMMGTGVASGENRAKQAAEAAVASPLIDNHNLQGARGILVNITGGMDMSIGEFDEVGNTVKELVSDEATVVIGTVLDPDMTDEIRVTVIIAGLGTPIPQENELVQKTKDTIRNKDGRLNYQHLESLAVVRKKKSPFSVKPMGGEKQTEESSVSQTQSKASVTDANYLDIPTFLRKREEN